MKTVQKQPPGGVLKKRYSGNIQQIYRRTPVPKCDFNKVASQLLKIALRYGCSPVNLLHIFRTPFPRNTSGWLRLTVATLRLSSKILLFSVRRMSASIGEIWLRIRSKRFRFSFCLKIVKKSFFSTLFEFNN